MSTVDNNNPPPLAAVQQGSQEDDGEERYERLGSFLLPADAMLEIISYVCYPGDYATLSKLSKSTHSFRKVINDPSNDVTIWQKKTARTVRDHRVPPVAFPVIDPNWGQTQGLITHKQVSRRLFLLGKIREEQGIYCISENDDDDTKETLMGGRVDNILIAELGMGQCRKIVNHDITSGYCSDEKCNDTAIICLLGLAQENIIHYLQKVMLPSMMSDKDDANLRFDRCYDSEYEPYCLWNGSVDGAGRERNVAVRRIAYRAGIPELPAGSGGYQFIWSTIFGIMNAIMRQIYDYREHHRQCRHFYHSRHHLGRITKEEIEYHAGEFRYTGLVNDDRYEYLHMLETLKCTKVYCDNQEFADDGEDSVSSSFELDDDEEPGERFVLRHEESDVDLEYDTDPWDMSECESYETTDDESDDDEGMEAS